MRPVTEKQRNYLITLAQQAKEELPTPTTQHEVSREIGRLKQVILEARPFKPITRISHGHTITQIGPNHFEGRPLEVQGR